MSWGLFRVAAYIIVAYLIASVPAAYIVTRLATGKDIRSLGSGNPGATNVFRELGAKYALPVFAFDFLKGFVPVLVAMRAGVDFPFPRELVAIGAGVGAILGHLFPLFLGFKGGKGVATGAGAASALFPPLVPVCASVFGAVLALSRKMSLASMCGAVSMPLAYAAIALAIGRPFSWWLFAFFSLASGAVLARHWRNVRRLREGMERSLF